MTINDMIDAGICIEGTVEIRAYRNEEDYASYTKREWDSIYSKIPERVRELDVDYMFAQANEVYGSFLVIECSIEE
jgi:hypothetical protein